METFEQEKKEYMARYTSYFGQKYNHKYWTVEKRQKKKEDMANDALYFGQKYNCKYWKVEKRQKRT